MRLTIAFAVDSVLFTRAVVDGSASLGGSESACLGLARALVARGHDVHLFTTKQDADVEGVDHAGLVWHRMEDLSVYSMLKDWDVLVALRMPDALTMTPAKFKVLWCQDLMAHEQMKLGIMAQAFSYDAVAYVSEYHRHQWEAIAPELAPIGYVTRNGYDESLVPRDITKDPNRIIHISRPERGLAPLLAMWPKLKAQCPHATLQICRYSSMYDAGGWGEVCKDFDRLVAQVNEAVGGITYLGELGKAELYKAIAEAAVMWYPGVASFAETSCIAAIEAQACGTPFVGSYRGALTETAPYATLIPGDAEADDAYHEASITAVIAALDGCARSSVAYREAQRQGRAHVHPSYTYAAIAAEWESWLASSFSTRYESRKRDVLARLMHEDDILSAELVAAELGDSEALEQCARIKSGQIVQPEEYARRAMDTLTELDANGPRLRAAVEAMNGAKRVLDVACGNGAFAVGLALADPERHVTAVDYAQANIDAGRAAAEARGVADRITWVCAPVWDFDANAPAAWLGEAGTFDGLWCGEFLEHVVDCVGLVNALEARVSRGGRIAFSVPMGALGQIETPSDQHPLTHVHHFRPADLQAMFGGKRDLAMSIVPWHGVSPRGETTGNWVVGYTKDGSRTTGLRPLERRILTRPHASITAGLIVNDTTDLRRCLTAVWPMVDEIVLGDTGCVSGALDAVAAEFPRKTRVIPVGPVQDLPNGFSEARNRVLDEARTEWFFWVDADEVLCGGQALQKYLHGPVFNGFVIKQQHLQLDAAMGTDRPHRVFRRRSDIRFYGCVHEQPQQGDCNGAIVPALEVTDVQLAHTGYLHEGIRREKALGRNLPLILRDQQQFPDRELGKVLLMRDYANLAMWAKERSGGRMTPEVKRYQTAVIAMFEAKFMDPTNIYHAVGRPFYEAALRDVAGAIEVEVGLVGAPGGLQGNRARAERVWVRTPEHLRSLLQGRLDAMLKPLETPAVLDTLPLVPQPSSELEALTA